MITIFEWLLQEEKQLVSPSVAQSYENAFKQGLHRLIQRTQDPVLRDKFKEMFDCPLQDRKGQCRGFTAYIIAALVRSGIARNYDMEEALHYVAEKMLMDRSLATGELRSTVFDGFDATKPYNADENPLQARFLTYLNFAISTIRKGAVPRLANVERRPQGVCSITPGRQREGDPKHGIPADELPARSSVDAPFKELVDDTTALLSPQEATTGLPLVALFRQMMAGMRSAEQRKQFGDTRTRLGRQVIVQTIEQYARSTGNHQPLRLLTKFQGDDQEVQPVTPKLSPAAKPALTDKQRDYASILDVLYRLNRPTGTADLGKYRRRWLDYAPRTMGSTHRNRLKEVLARMLRDEVIVTRQTRQGATQYVPGPNAAAYRKGAS